jgi:hypothetical protein
MSLNVKHYDFIEIGTSDFDTLIETSNDDTIGISIEPIKHYLDRLPNKKNIIKVNAACSDSNENLKIYYISVEDIQKYNLPYWVRGCNSVNKPHNYTRVLFLAPHLSTGGMPSFLLKRIESLLKYYNEKVELFVVEYSNHSDHYVVQKK